MNKITKNTIEAFEKTKAEYYDHNYNNVQKIIRNYSASLNLANINNNSISSGITATTTSSQPSELLFPSLAQEAQKTSDTRDKHWFGPQLMRGMSGSLVSKN